MTWKLHTHFFAITHLGSVLAGPPSAPWSFLSFSSALGCDSGVCEGLHVDPALHSCADQW